MRQHVGGRKRKKEENHLEPKNENKRKTIQCFREYQRTGSASSVTGFPLNGQVIFKRLHWVLVITMSSCSSSAIGSPA